MSTQKAFRMTYAQSLRIIGQDLEARRVVNFDLAVSGGGFVVRRRLPPLGAWVISPRLLAAHWRRNSKIPSEIHYSTDELQRLAAQGAARRKYPDGTPDYSLSQTLRTVGLLIDQNELRFLGLKRRGPTLVLEFEGRGGQRVLERRMIASLRNDFLRMFFSRRKKRSSVDQGIGQ